MVLKPEEVRHYLVTLATFVGNADLREACKAQMPEGVTLGIILLKPEQLNPFLPPQEVMIQVPNATDEWEAEQDWMEDVIQIFQTDPPEGARGDLDDRFEYISENAMPWDGINEGIVPDWYQLLYLSFPVLQEFIDNPEA